MTSTGSADFQVVIIGGGPIGLVSAIQLGQAGIKTLLLERRATFSAHPKAAGIHARTMEVFRQIGLAALIREHGEFSAEKFTIAWMTRLNGMELGKLTLGANKAETDLFSSWSPETMAFCSQDIYEPLYAAELKKYPSIELRTNSPATAIHPDEDGVTVQYTTPDQAPQSVRALYVIGADGVRSPTRNWLGITETTTPSFGTSINVVFAADLERYRAGREYSMTWIVNGDTQGAFGWRRRSDRWSYGFECEAGKDPADYTPERCAEIIRIAAGAPPDLEVKVLSTLHWRHDQAVTDRWRVGRVFLAGDAAHRFPPHGGFGMNSGIQDSHNLVWKLIARLRWNAGDGLLNSYEPERKPIAQFNGEQCLINTRRMEETGWLLKDPRALAAIETPEGEPLRQKISAAVPKQREQLFSQGQQFGRIYVSNAIIDDGTVAEESTISTYRPTGHPGARTPHVWLQDSTGRTISTIDLYDGSFILFAARDGEAWVSAASELAKQLRAPLKAIRIGSPGYAQRPGDATWESVVGVGNTGALLVRPDGHVAVRWSTIPGDPKGALGAAFEQLLDIKLDYRAEERVAS